VQAVATDFGSARDYRYLFENGGPSLVLRMTLPLLTVSLSLVLIQRIPGADGAPVLMPLLLVVIFNAWAGGMVSGLLATILSVVGAVYFYLTPGSLLTLTGNDSTRLVVFIFLSLLACAGMQWDRHHRRLLREREARNRMLLESAPEAVLVLDEHGVIRQANQGARPVFGYAPEELVGQPITLLQPERLREAHLRAFERFLDLGEKTIDWRRLETWGLHRDGTEFPLELSFSHTRLGTGHLFVGFLRDVSERRRAEAALRESEAALRRLFDSAPFGIYRSTREGRMLAANPAFLRIFGYASEEEVKALDVARDLYVDPAERQEIIEQAKAGFIDREARMKRKDGKPILVRMTHRFVTDPETGTVYNEGFLQDVSAEREMENQLRQAQKMEAVGRLAGGVAHDFNNLLMIIRGNAELAISDLPPDHESVPRLEAVVMATERATYVTNQLLTFSRRGTQTPRCLEVGPFLHDTSKLFGRLLEANIRMRVEIAEGLGKVVVDPGGLTQVLINLVTNARDAMPQGGVITLRAENAILDAYYARLHAGVTPGPYVSITVADTGIGIDLGTQARIFEPFFTTKEVGKGTGLGLATVHGIVRQNGGHLWLYSEPGRGATFKIYLPRVQREQDAPSEAETSEVPRGSGLVLLVEDNEAMRAITQEYLQGKGYSVVEARSGEEALALFQRSAQPVRFLVSDIVMPGMSGRELARRLHRLAPEVRMVMMSGYSEQGISVQDLPQGTQFLQKPFAFDDLARALHRGGEERLQDGPDQATLTA
jgi:two-component system cell cycle sensor histidine kinase/response regulator CckA